jgi:hypothetical protein
MKAIQTRYLGATNYRGSRIKASAEGVPAVTIPYPHELDTERAHRSAAAALAARHDWTQKIHGGALPSGDWAWVFVTGLKCN